MQKLDVLTKNAQQMHLTKVMQMMVKEVQKVQLKSTMMLEH